MAEGRVKGIFPGGPTRRTQGAGKAPPRSTEELGAAWDQALLRSRRKRRSLRLAAGSLAAAAVAGGASFVLGLQVPEPEPTVGEGIRAVSAERDRAVSAEVNRMLLEFRRMELAESTRGAGAGGRP